MSWIGWIKNEIQFHFSFHICCKTLKLCKIMVKGFFFALWRVNENIALSKEGGEFELREERP